MKWVSGELAECGSLFQEFLTWGEPVDRFIRGLDQFTNCVGEVDQIGHCSKINPIVYCSREQSETNYEHLNCGSEGNMSMRIRDPNACGKKTPFKGVLLFYCGDDQADPIDYCLKVNTIVYCSREQSETNYEDLNCGSEGNMSIRFRYPDACGIKTPFKGVLPSYCGDHQADPIFYCSKFDLIGYCSKVETHNPPTKSP